MATVVAEPTARVEETTTGAQVIGRSPWELFWRRFRSDRLAFIGIGVIIFMALMAILAPLIASAYGKQYSHVFISPGSAFPGSPNGFVRGETGVPLPRSPDGEFWFGTDAGAKDVFIKVVYGARTSLTTAMFATSIALVLGVIIGLVAGFYKGKVDTFLSRITDIVMSLPILLLALGLAAACSLPPPEGGPAGCLGGLIRPGIPLVAIIIGFFSWPYISRIVRGQVLSLREREFVEAARALGSGNARIMFREILPNVVAPILVYTTLIIPNNILFEAALSFLGAGVPATTPSWGRMIADAANTFTFAWWTMIFPGVFLFLTTLAFNLVGDGLRDALDPRTGR
jgi:peptide/nickel transport system permease protein